MVGRLPFFAGLALILTMIGVAVFAGHLAAYDPLRSSVDMLDLPSTRHWLGTDDLGRDILSRLLYGARTSLLIGGGAASVALLIGVPVGLATGYFRGTLDLVVVPLIDLFIALPGLVLALIITVVVGPSLLNLVLVLGFVMWPPIARLVRGQVLAVRENTYIEAARALGAGPAWIIGRHVLPNIMNVVSSQFAVTVSFAIFTSASLSFLGLGVPPPTPDWGSMVRGGFEFLAINPWLSLGPGAAVTATVIGFYLLGSSLR